MLSPEKISKLVDIALRQLAASARFKAPRMNIIKKYEEAYMGKVQPKLRQAFQVPIPVFSGLVDTLQADVDDPMNLQFTENNPADYNAIRKVNASFTQATASLDRDSLFQMKLSWDKFNAIISGVGIPKSFASSVDGFKFEFSVTNYVNFHCEPKGGGYLEDHLFCGEDGITKTEKQLLNGPYSKDAVTRMLEKVSSDDIKTEWQASTDYDIFSMYRASGFDPTIGYVGEHTFNLVEWVLENEGKRYYLLFDPWTREAARAEELAEITESCLYPWSPWQTHPNQKLFWSKSYADDFYPVHEAITTMVNQELTNRDKRNSGAKAYDPAMFPDVGKLDKAQYRKDALVPVDLKGGTRKINEGLFEFSTPELKGTLELAGWLENELTKNAGVFEMQPGGQVKGKGAQVQFAMLQQAQKRLTQKSRQYSRAYSEVGLRYLWGLKEHMSGTMAVHLTGADGYGWDQLRKSELTFKKAPNVTIVNLSEEDKNNVLGKDQKSKAMDKIVGSEVLMSQINPKWLTESILRDLGGFDDSTIKTAMDVQNFANKDVMAEAERVIQEMVKGKTPDPVYTANIAFLRRILDFVKTHEITLGSKAHLFFDYIVAMGPIVHENMMDLAQQLRISRGAGGGAPGAGGEGIPQGQPGQAGQPGQGAPGQPPQTQQTSRTAGPGVPQAQMGNMAIAGQ